MPSTSNVRSLLLMGMLLTLAGGFAARAHAADAANPAYAGWAKFKPGSTVFWIEEEMIGNDKESIGRSQSLVSVSPDKVVIEKQMLLIDGGKVVEGSGGPPKKETISAKDDAKVTDGKPVSEEIEALGKKLKCTVTERTVKSGDGDIIVKTWWNDSIPGGIAKLTETNKTSGKVVRSLTLNKTTVK